jgi:peptidoglycan/xylan/chitin deacetylase (PgdA/CDA1 family)
VQDRRIAVGVAIAAIAGAAAFAVSQHQATAEHRLAPAQPNRHALEMRDLPVPVPIPPHRYHGPRLHTAVPILMYHAIGAPPAGAPYPDLFVSRTRFRGQVRALAAAGYHPVTLDRVWQAWHGRAPLPWRPIVLTFDDGYRGDFGQALPVLRRRHWPAVLNLLVANLHRHGWGLDPAMVRRMIANGWEVDSHTLTHPDLATVAPARLRREVSGSRTVLRRMFHVPVAFFCYPSGDFDKAVVAAVRRAGYLGATTELPGLALPSHPDTLARIRVDAGESPGRLLHTIAAS